MDYTARAAAYPQSMADTIETRSTAARSGRRIAELDILRGLALFGILITNAIVATTLWSVVGTKDTPALRYDGAVDQVVRATVDALFTGRFYLLFAFLFGYSFTLQIAAAQRAGLTPRGRLLRRCAALMTIGLAHVWLLWFGDILTLYAFLCLILITLRKLRPRTALITGAVLYLGWTAWSFLPGDYNNILAFGRFVDLPALAADFTGGPAATFDAQIGLAPVFLLVIWFAQGVPSLAMFLIGMAAGKRNLFADIDTLRRWAPRVLLLGLGLGLPVSALTFADKMSWWDAPSVVSGLQQVVNPAMTAAYVAAAWLAAHHARTARATALLAPAGRMAATNYIGQSIVLMLVYTGYGFALADTVPPLGVVAIGLLTFAAQLAFSAWWLRRHPYGPVEWVLRAATYLTIPAWRRPARQPETTG